MFDQNVPIVKMKIKFKIIYSILLVLIISSCESFKEINIEKVKSYQFKGFNDNKLVFNLVVPIDNPNSQNIIISEVNLKAYIKNTPVGILETTNKLIIKKNTKQDYEIPITIKITNLLGSFSLMINPSDVIEQIRFEGYIKIRKGILIRTIEIDKNLSEQYIKF